MNCPGCGAPMRLDIARELYACDFCTDIVVPDPDSDGVRMFESLSGRYCPACRRELHQASAEHQIMEACPNCHGILMSAPAFSEVIAAKRARLSDFEGPPRAIGTGELDRVLFCPGCGRKMDTFPYGGAGNIVMDNCPRCDLNWLDHTELHRVVHGAGGDRPTAAEL